MHHYVNILQKILRLRQICCHVSLPGNLTSKLADLSTADFDERFAHRAFNLMRENDSLQCSICSFDFSSWRPPDDEVSEEDETSSQSSKARRTKGNSASSSRTTSPEPSQRTLSLVPVMTKCQHLYCSDCFRANICPEYSNVIEPTACPACDQQLANAKDFVALTSIPLSSTSIEEDIPLQATDVDYKAHTSAKITALIEDLTVFSQSNEHSVNYDEKSINIIVESDAMPNKTVVLFVALDSDATF